MKKTNKLLYEVAIHEAGHAVAELRFGLNLIKSVSVIGDEVSYGRVIVKLKKTMIKKLQAGELTANAEKYFRLNMIASLAGPLAGSKYVKTKDLDIKRGARGDVRAVYNLATEMITNRKLANAYVNYLIEAARYFVNDKTNWKLIKAIAKELVKYKTLSFENCESICMQLLGLDTHDFFVPRFNL